MAFSTRGWPQRASLILLACVAFACIITWLFPSSLSKTVMLQPLYGGQVSNEQYTRQNDRPDIRLKPQLNKHGFDDPLDAKFYNIILEEDALSFEPCRDINKSASTKHSKVVFADRSRGQYHVGEVIRVSVLLHDGNGLRKYSGGDQLRATIENKTLDASAPCIVTDNGDGTYMILCEALWAGKSIIVVTLAYTRETITSIYRIRTEILATRNIYGLFKSRSFREETLCHPNDTHLVKLTNYTKLCNMTYINSGMPFYCGKPANVHLLCQDWEQVTTREPYPELPITKCEDMLLKRGQRILKQKLCVDVAVRRQNTSQLLIAKPTTPCSEYNVSLLWHSRTPTGFFYNGKWVLRNCIGASESSYMSCLQNRHVYLFGDSTLRAWYSSIIKRFQCQPITEKWLNEKWHKEAECYNKKINFHAGWYPHSQPFYVGKSWDDVRYTLYSVSRRIDDIPSKTRAIVIIQLYMHLLAFHHNVFKQRMEIIRKSIEKLLLKSNESIVMIKGPHTFEGTPAGGVRLSDYYGYVYSMILYEVFEGLHDRVVLLNNRDTTLAKHVQWNHPSEDIVDVMVDQMLSYACK